MGSMESYERDFQEQLLTETAAYYKRKANLWIEQDSCPDYMIKAEEALRLEEERVEIYLHPSTKVGTYWPKPIASGMHVQDAGLGAIGFFCLGFFQALTCWHLQGTCAALHALAI